MKRAAIVFAAMFVLLVGSVSLAWAQSAGTSSIGGTVEDPHGLVVPGAEVVVRNVDTGAERTLTTNEAGLYAAPYLIPGHYEVRVRKEGFAEVLRQNLNLEVGQTLAINIQLPIQATQQTVTVTAAPARITTENFDVGQTIAQYQVENLPLNGRNWTNFVLLTPGVSEDGGFGLVSYRGISALYNNNMVDGADNNQAFFSEARGRTRLPYVYSLDAVKEFEVETGVYSAEFGRAAGGIVNAVTKSGTNSYHGDAFYFIRDDSWLAADPTANAAGRPRPGDRRQQFGGSFGGPIKREKLFFFANYDQQKHTYPFVVTPGRTNFFDPASPGSQASNCPSGTTPSLAQCTTVLNALQPIFNAVVPRKGDNYIGLGKIDYQLNANNRISGVVNVLRWDGPNAILASGTTFNTSESGTGNDLVHDQFVTASWNAVLTPTLVNEARFQYGQDFEFETANHSGPGIIINNGAGFGMASFLPRGKYPDERRYQFSDNVSWIRGRHQFKLGYDINHVTDDFQNLFNGGGTLAYFGAFALRNFVNDISNGTRSYSRFTQAGDPITGSGTGFFASNDYNFYFQDNLKLRRDFTLYLGLRYELQNMPDVVLANPLVPESAKLNTDTNNFGPRVGLAWDIRGHHKEVIRAGYGIYYGRTQNSTILTHLFQNGVFQQSFFVRPSSCGAPAAPNDLFPQPGTAPAYSPIFGTSGPTPSATFPSVGAYIAACGRGSATADALDPTFVNPLVHEYDVNFEQELPLKLDLTVSYLGSRANHLPIFYDANLSAPNSTRAYLVFDANGNPMNPTVFTVPFFSGAARPRPGSALLMGKSIINSWYNGLVIRVRRRETRGFSFDANFTYSKSIDDGAQDGTDGTFTGTIEPLNPFDVRGEYGPSNLDIRKRFVMNFYWVTPFAKWTQSHALKALIGGWMASGVFHAQSGHPVTGLVSGNPGDCNLDGGLTCGVQGSFGSDDGRVPFIARNSQFTAPGLVNFDLRIDREFKITERTSFEFIWEAFNLFNETHITGVRNSAFNFVAAGSTPFCSASVPGLPNYDGCVQQDRSFLTSLFTSNNLYGARQMQFGARFRF